MKKLTKKQITIDLLDSEGGATVERIAKDYESRYGDHNMEKNRTVAKLWLTKIGFQVDSRIKNGEKYYFRKK